MTTSIARATPQSRPATDPPQFNSASWRNAKARSALRWLPVHSPQTKRPSIFLIQKRGKRNAEIYPDPTFKFPVNPSEVKADRRIEFEFRHKTRDELKTLLDDMRETETTDEQVLGDVVASRSDVDEVHARALNKLIQNYASAAGSFIDGLCRGTHQGRPGN